MAKMGIKDLDRTLSTGEMQEPEAAEQLHPVFDSESPEINAMIHLPTVTELRNL